MKKSLLFLAARAGAGLLFLLFLVLISLPNLVNWDGLRPALRNYVGARVNGSFELAGVKPTFRYGPGLRLEKVRLSSPANDQRITVETVIAAFSLTDLFRRRLTLKRVLLVEPDLDLSLARRVSPWTLFKKNQPAGLGQTGQGNSGDRAVVQPQADLEKSPATARPENIWQRLSRSWVFSEDLSRMRLKVVNGRLVFSDSLCPTTPLTIKLRNFQFKLTPRTTASATAGFSLSAEVEDEGGNGAVDLAGTLSGLIFPLKPADMKLDCRVRADNLNSAAYFPYYQRYVPMRFIGGRLSIDADYRGSLMGLFSSRGRIEIRHGRLDYPKVFSRLIDPENLRIDYDFRLADHYNTIEIPDFHLASGQLSLSGSCFLYDMRQGIDGRIAAEFSLPETGTAALAAVLPWEIIPEKVAKWRSQLLPEGRIAVQGGFIKACYRDLPCLRAAGSQPGLIGGSFQLRDQKFSLAGLEGTVHALEGQLNGNQLQLKNCGFSWSGIEAEAIDAELEKLYLDPELELAGHFRCQPGLVQNHFRDLGARGAGTISKISFKGGMIEGDLAFAGLLLNQARQKWGGSLQVADLALGLPYLGLELEKAQGEIVLDGRRLLLEDFTMQNAAGRFALSGVLPDITLLKDGITEDIDLEIEALEPEPTVLGLWPLPFLPPLIGNRNGPSKLSLSLRGLPGSQWRAAGEFDCHWRNLRRADNDLPLFDRLDCLGKFGPEGMRIDAARLFLGKSDLGFAAVYKNVNRNPSLKLKLNSRYLSTADFGRDLLLNFLAAADENSPPQAAGLLPVETGPPAFPTTGPRPPAEVNDVAAASGELEKFPFFELDAALAEVCLAPVQPGKTGLPWRHLRNCNLSLSGRGLRQCRIENCAWQWGAADSLVKITGEVAWDQNFSGNLKLNLSGLDLDKLSGVTSCPPPEPKTPENDFDQNAPLEAPVLSRISRMVKPDLVADIIAFKPRLSALRGRVQLEADDLRWRGLLLDHLQGDCCLTGETAMVNDLSGRVFGGRFSSSLSWDYPENRFAFLSDFDQVDLGRINSCFLKADNGLPMHGGIGSLLLDLDWQGQDNEQWRKTLDGIVDFTFREGYLKKYTMIANLCSLLNLSQFAALKLPKISLDQGVFYQQLKGHGILDQGVLDLDELTLEGPSFNIYSSGHISLVEDNLELDIGVQPLQTVDKLLATIPLVGYILTGEEKTFVVFPMTASGPFDQVAIKARPLTGIGKGAGSILQRFFTTPLRLLRMPAELINGIGSDRQPGRIPDQKAVK